MAKQQKTKKRVAKSKTPAQKLASANKNKNTQAITTTPAQRRINSLLNDIENDKKRAEDRLRQKEIEGDKQIEVKKHPKLKAVLIALVAVISIAAISTEVYFIAHQQTNTKKVDKK
ncbi:MAG: hypothetical protein LBM27_01975 [Lactobacillaceae bacterium]|jgi:hypothetical protein|nr:hypothetical protein [Lactobacillaceae bacterium]